MIQMTYLVEHNAPLSGVLSVIASQGNNPNECTEINITRKYEVDETTRQRDRRLSGYNPGTMSNLRVQTYTKEGHLIIWQTPDTEHEQLKYWKGLQMAILNRAKDIGSDYISALAAAMIVNYKQYNSSEKGDFNAVLRRIIDIGYTPNYDWIIYGDKKRSMIYIAKNENVDELGAYLNNIDKVISKEEYKRYKVREKEENKIIVEAESKKIVTIGFAAGFTKVNVKLSPNLSDIETSSPYTLSYLFPIGFRINDKYQVIAEGGVMLKTLKFGAVEEEGTHLNGSLLVRYNYKLNHRFVVYGNAGINYDYLENRNYTSGTTKREIDLEGTNRKRLGIGSGFGIVYRTIAGNLFLDYRFNYLLNGPTKHYTEFRYKKEVSVVDDRQNSILSMGVLLSLKGIFSN